MSQGQQAARGGVVAGLAGSTGPAAVHRGAGAAIGLRAGLAAAGIAGLLAGAAVQAQPTEFPEAAQPLEPAALQKRINGQVFAAKLANGVSWRLDYRQSGYFFIDVSTGGRVAGKWAVEGSSVCHEMRGAGGRDCAEFRLAGDQLMLKRTSNGEVVRLLSD